MSLSGQDLKTIGDMIEASIKGKIPGASIDGRGLVQLDQQKIGEEPQVVGINSRKLKFTAKAIALGGII